MLSNAIVWTTILGAYSDRTVSGSSTMFATGCMACRACPKFWKNEFSGEFNGD